MYGVVGPVSSMADMPEAFVGMLHTLCAGAEKTSSSSHSV